MTLRIIEPTPQYMETFKAGLMEIKAAPTPYDIHQVEEAIEFMDKNFEGYFDYLKKRKSPEQPQGRVPAGSLWLMDGDKFVGLYDIRYALNEALTKSGGNIAYLIIPSERKKGYVKAGLKLVLKWCYEHLGLDEVLLSCNQSNEASYRAMKSVMLEVGGRERPIVEIKGHMECSMWINTHQKTR